MKSAKTKKTKKAKTKQAVAPARHTPKQSPSIGKTPQPVAPEHKSTAGTPQQPKDADADYTDANPESLFSAIFHVKKRAFLVAYVETGGIRRASALSQVDWRNHYNWLEADEEYRAAFEKARQLAGDLAEDEIYRRAFLGFDHPVIYEGQITTTYKDHSDNLAMFYLKGLRPERYRENVNLSGNVGVSVDDFYNKIAGHQSGEPKS